jgi:hypothetical protein
MSEQICSDTAMTLDCANVSNNTCMQAKSESISSTSQCKPLRQSTPLQQDGSVAKGSGHQMQSEVLYLMAHIHNAATVGEGRYT